MSIKSYLKNLLYQPRKLLSELQQLDQQQFQTAMKYLFNSKKEHLVSDFTRWKGKAAVSGLGKWKGTGWGAHSSGPAVTYLAWIGFQDSLSS